MKTILLTLVIILQASNAMAHDKDEYSKLVCNKHKVCHVVKAHKPDTTIEYLDMSEIEGKSSDMPAISNKGKL